MSKVFRVFTSPVSFFKRHKVWSGILVLSLIALFVLFRPKPTIPPDTQRVAKTNLVQTVSVSGTIDADSKATLTFPIAGKLIWLGFTEGDVVKKYQTIALLDQRTLVQNLLNAQKALDNQQISFDIINDNNGDRTLADTGLSVSAFRQLKQAMDTLDQSKIAYAMQQIAQEQSVLTSPIDGIITHEDVKVSNVNVTTTTTITVVDPHTLVFNMDVDEADIAKVATGEAVKVVLDAYPNDTITLPVSKIDFVSHTTTNGGNAYTVKVNLPTDAKYQFKVGMNGNADIVTAEKDNVLTVPLSSIGDGNNVYIKTANGYKKQSITVGLENDINAEVLSGISQGDMVVLDPSKVPAKEIIR